MISECGNPLALPAKQTSSITVNVTGEKIAVDAWESIPYVSNPSEIIFHFPPIPEVPEIKTTQLLNLYIPSNANADSPVILYVDNSGWFINTSPVILKDGDELPANGGRTAAIGAALKAGYAVVTYTCRGRNDSPVNGEFQGHSPATITDTKAVIRYLRFNDASIPCDTKKIVVTGTSGGGALSSVIAASGNSVDFYQSLFAIGAAGMIDERTSTISDAVFAAIAYCPITDLPNADQAYEWVYGPVREAYKQDGLTLDEINPSPDAMGAPTDIDLVFGDSVLSASRELASDYIIYFNSLGLMDGDTVLQADNGTFKAAIRGLLEKGVEKAIADLANATDYVDPMGEYCWLTITCDKATIDWDKYLYWIGTEKTGLKTAPAFSNRGTANQHPVLNEDNVFGSPADSYSPFHFWSWNNHIDGHVNVGKNNTNLNWEEYLQTDDGKRLLLQMKMTNPISYLQSQSEGESAPYWYVRHGMADRDTSFAVEATLYYALLNDSNIKDINFNFSWLKGHAGDYAVPEAYDWLAGVLTRD